MSSSTLTALVSEQVDTAWSYLSAVIGTVWPFVLGASIIIGVIYLLIRMVRGAR